MEGEDASKRAATVARLTQLRDAQQMAAAHVRLAAALLE
jgi:putative transposase